MNVKPPFQNTEHKIKYAPKRGSSEYWYYLIFFVFLIPFILSSIVSGLFLNQISPKLCLLSPFIGLIIALWNTRRIHRKAYAMKREDYIDFFRMKAISGKVPTHNKTDDPLDPFSDSYQIMGPGSHHYKQFHED